MADGGRKVGWLLVASLFAVVAVLVPIRILYVKGQTVPLTPGAVTTLRRTLNSWPGVSVLGGMLK